MTVLRDALLEESVLVLPVEIPLSGIARPFDTLLLVLLKIQAFLHNVIRFEFLIMKCIH